MKNLKTNETETGTGLDVTVVVAPGSVSFLFNLWQLITRRF